MTIVELLNVTAVEANLRAETKEQVLEEMTDVMLRAAPLDHEQVLSVLQERERLGSTGIGSGVAIPHGKIADIDKMYLAFGRSIKGVDFDSMDGKPAHLFFLLIAPEESVSTHLKTLARISKLLKKQDVRTELLEADNAEVIYKIIRAEDSV
ncbi:MAG: PTS sugar transporter subunit IIA [Desulfuromonadaceae bacterium]|nr:PTS sugar transporter subunit IIA [Desulfuromonas sp.]MDY0184684.1 PTS sugar transporter subunit IIA [Desulfuromonadaceae bacterium]